jgi:hypothetical protein
VGGQDDVDGGNPHVGVDGGVDPPMGAHGGGKKLQRCKSLMSARQNRRQKLNDSFVVPNTTKVTKCFLYPKIASYDMDSIICSSSS